MMLILASLVAGVIGVELRLGERILAAGRWIRSARIRLPVF
jgi:hypothetical protein